MDSEGIIEQTLWLCREVFVYRIPPRPGAGGWRSGEWRVGDKIFSGRCRIVAIGDNCEVRIEDTSTNDIFAICPVPFGRKSISVESVTDSSRYFVLRVEDPVTKRHAFLGLGFAERGDAFDFNVALADHERHVQIAHAAANVASPGGPQHSLPRPNVMDEAVASLYKHNGDLSLKEGQTIRINVKKTLGRASSGSSTTAVPLTALAPPPASKGPVSLSPPPSAAPAPRLTTKAFSTFGASEAAPAATSGGLQAKVTTDWAVFE